MDITGLTKSIEDAASAGLDTLGEPERQKLLATCTKLSEQLKKPHELVLEISTGVKNHHSRMTKAQ